MSLLLLLMPVLFVAVPAALWFRSRDEARRRWLPRQQGTTHVGDQNYRGAEVPRMVADGPPPLVHVAAVMCWIFGVAFLPGLAMTLVGLLAMGIGVVGIPGLIAAARLFRLGGPLLRGEPEAAQQARDAGRYVRWLNYVVLAIASMFGAAGLWEWASRGRMSGDVRGVMAMVGFTVFYAVVSLVHARLLDRAADHIDADQAQRAAQRGEAPAAASGEAGDELPEARTGVRVASDEGLGFDAEAQEVSAASAGEGQARRAGR
ncbi:MAG: hypothetical protein U0325_09915 [Polyangiales bacterium]